MTGITALVAAGSAPRVTLEDVSVTVVRTGATATAAFRVGADGLLYKAENGGAYTLLSPWLLPSVSALAGIYEARATVLAGTLTSGTTGSWLALTADQTWTLAKASAGGATASFTLEIRQAASGTVLDSCTVQLEAEYV